MVQAMLCKDTEEESRVAGARSRDHWPFRGGKIPVRGLAQDQPSVVITPPHQLPTTAFAALGTMSFAFLDAKREMTSTLATNAELLSVPRDGQ